MLPVAGQVTRPFLEFTSAASGHFQGAMFRQNVLHDKPQAPSHQFRFGTARRLLQMFQDHTVFVAQASVDISFHRFNCSTKLLTVLHIGPSDGPKAMIAQVSAGALRGQHRPGFVWFTKPGDRRRSIVSKPKASIIRQPLQNPILIRILQMCGLRAGLFRLFGTGSGRSAAFRVPIHDEIHCRQNQQYQDR